MSVEFWQKTGRCIVETDSQSTYQGKVSVVDDDMGFRNAVVRVLNASGFETLSYGCVGDYLIAESRYSPGCMLLDIYMPGPSGLDLWDALSARDFTPPTIFLTGCGDVLTSVRAMKAGAIDFISKPVEVPRLIQSVRHALAVDAERRAEFSYRQEVLQKYEMLESVERAVFFGVVNGKLNKQLAADLDKCERTIKTYRAQMMSKLNVTSLPELVRMARFLNNSPRKVERLGSSSVKFGPRLDDPEYECEGTQLVKERSALQ
jgi:FixJ family two-component response regulator